MTAFYRDARGRLYYATANPGKLFRLSSGPRDRAAPTNRSRATRRWCRPGARSAGAARRRRGNRIELFTRSGNTETPDDTWSAWSAAYINAEGSPITSPKARYLQWRAVLTGQGDGPGADVGDRGLPAAQSAARRSARSPSIRRASSFRSRSRPASRSSPASTIRRRRIASSPAAASAQPGASSPSLGRRTYQKGLQTLVWKADDENDDDLVYDVLYRREGETAWKTLRKATTRRRSSSGTRRRFRTAPTS